MYIRSSTWIPIADVHTLSWNRFMITWNRFPHYLSFMMGIHRSPVDSPHKRPVMQSFDVFFVVRLNKLLNQHSRYRCFETTWRSCDCNIMGIYGCHDYGPQIMTSWHGKAFGITGRLSHTMTDRWPIERPLRQGLPPFCKCAVNNDLVLENNMWSTVQEVDCVV